MCRSHYAKAYYSHDFEVHKRPEHCKFEGCSKPHSAKGYCERHWARLRRHGDPASVNTTSSEEIQAMIETAKKFRGPECLDWPYGVSNRGLPYQGKHGKPILFNLCKSRHGPSRKKGTRHFPTQTCGNKKCINPDHLKWATVGERKALRLQNGLAKSKLKGGKLTAKDVLAIRKSKETNVSLAQKFGVHQVGISRIKHYHSWGWLKEDAHV